MKKTTLVPLLGLLSFLGTAFGADRPAAPGQPTSQAKLPARSKVDWANMNAGQRKSYMKKTVLPEMKRLFVGFDDEYKGMSCGTCHGDKAADNKFHMPNAELPKLPAPTDGEGFAVMKRKKTAAARFMATQVVPAMAALLNLDEWKPTNPKGFGCYGCHTQNAAPAVSPAAAAAGGW